MASISLPFLWSGKMLIKGIAFAIQKYHARILWRAYFFYAEAT